MDKLTVPPTTEPPDKVDPFNALPGLPQVTQSDDGFIGNDKPDDKPEKSEFDKLRGTLSSKGDKFDPSIHAYPPKETQGGKWAKKRGRAGKGSETPDPADTNTAFRNEAQQTAHMYALFNHVALGEGADIKEAELLPMVDAWQRYYQVNGISEQNPLTGVLLTSGLYSYGVATRPAVWPRVKEGLAFIGKKLKLIKEEEDENALDDSGE